MQVALLMQKSNVMNFINISSKFNTIPSLREETYT